ncbi:MAG: TPM domain-containing protein [Ahniella sp.]|nr:TPM domain-containing protein [Ahniella sp.]
MPKTLKHSLLYTALTFALAGCGGGHADGASGSGLVAANESVQSKLSEQQLIDEVASTLQACSYDGKPVTVSAQMMTAGAAGAGTDVVREIMKYTGLPQNFEVIPSGQVPNAAAVILVGPDNLPKRVIAYNEKFMGEVRSATANNDWAPISIMAHEIGHHLSGHTIQPGGSQPPTELEADKFSGFVLYKMGAVLADATKAMNTLVPEQDGPTHPGRGKRVNAIQEGWQQACAQQSEDCSGDTAVAAATPAVVADAPRPPAVSPATPAGDQDDLGFPTFPSSGADGVDPAANTVAGTYKPDVLPAPDASATPSKFGKFVIDELGVLDPATRNAFEKQMYDLAAEHQVEIVTIVAKSLHGKSAEEYAYAMMRQLRVGKLDVGNGAVLVVAPNEKQAGVAMGPGIMLELRDYVELEKERLMGFIDIGVPYCKGACNADQTELALGAAAHVASSVSHWDFGIRYQGLADLMAKFEEIETSRMNGASIEPEQDPTWRQVTRISGKLVSRNPAAGDQAKWINDAHVENVGPAMHVVSDDGRNLLVYADTHTEQLMTGKLVEGQKYVFIAREASLSMNPEDTLSFDLLSFDLAQ